MCLAKPATTNCQKGKSVEPYTIVHQLSRIAIKSTAEQ